MNSQRQPPASPLLPAHQHSHLHLHNPHGGHHQLGSQLLPQQPQNTPSRKPSIVEILSSPPPLPATPDHEDLNSFSLSRHTSSSSRSSILTGNNSGTHHSGSVVGLDWLEIPLSELTELNKLISINSSYSVQSAFETLLTHNLTSIPVSLSPTNLHELANCLTFDYSDLNTYLLIVMNKINPNDLSVEELGSPGWTLQQKQELLMHNIAKAKRGEEVPVDFIVKLHPKNPFLKFSESDTLYRAMEALGNGVHRVAITDPHDKNKITGILSQRRLIKYMWENARRFNNLDFFLNSTLQDLKIGSNTPIFIYEDQMLIEALQKMFNERVSSLAVINKTKNLIANISIVDVKNVSSTKNSHLLFKSVLNFISYNLSQKGIEEGQDQFPIFHVNNQSSLGRVIAKLVATQSHRLWIVEGRTSVHTHSNSISGGSISDGPSTIEAILNTQEGAPNVQQLPAQTEGRPGKLIGVVTLTDILGLFAQSKSNGRRIDPQAARNQRRRSSTSTTRSSIDGIPASSGIAGPTSGQQPPPSPSANQQEIFRKSYITDKKSGVFNK